MGPARPSRHELTVTDRSAPHRLALRRQALHAAASVVLAFSAGCAGGKSAAPAPDPGPTSETPPAPAAAPAAADTLEARIAAVRAPYQKVCGPEGETKACCDALREACTEAFGAESTDLDRCVFGPGTDGSHGCTPWGPPVPPAMA
jgi:hypothetical protein